MLTNSQIKLIKSLHTKKGRQKNGLCLIEGKKIIDQAKNYIEFTFTNKEKKFKNLVTTETPQNIAGIAKIPKFDLTDISKKATIVVLDNVQDPGNVGTIKTVPGEVKACRYCPVVSICTQAETMLADGRLVL